MVKQEKSVLEKRLTQMRHAAEERDAQRRAKKSGVPYVDLATAPINVEAVALIPEDKAKKSYTAAIEMKKKDVAIIALNPTSDATKEVVTNLENQGYKVSVFTTSLRGLSHVWNFYKFIPQAQEKITGGIHGEEAKLAKLSKELVSLEKVKSALRGEIAENNTSQALNVIMAGALANRASDIHLEPEEGGMKFRVRIDGILHDVFEGILIRTYSHILSRVKLLSRLKINIHDEPQDGRFSIKLEEKEVEVRVAIAPAEFGEVVVMRLLDPDAINLSLTQLGLRDDDLAIIETELKKPHGLILNTGPTGSGKTTTLYAFLKHKKSTEIKIITIEDPIEYHLGGVEQTQVNREVGYTFATGLRSVMRQDPDAILVGEIRDKDTAEIGVQAALTGHLVFSTVHANEAAGAVPRLLDLGVNPSSLAAGLNLVIGQRLVRRLCEKCKKKKKTPPDIKEKVMLFKTSIPERAKAFVPDEPTLFEAKGCADCQKTGYRGRIAIYELLQAGDKAEPLIMKSIGELELRQWARKEGMVMMQEDGIIKVLTGVTTFEELEGVTGPMQWEYKT